MISKGLSADSLEMSNYRGNLGKGAGFGVLFLLGSGNEKVSAERMHNSEESSP